MTEFYRKSRVVFFTKFLRYSLTVYSLTRYLLLWEENDSTERKKNSMNETASSPNDTTNAIEPKSSNDKCVVTGIYGLQNKAKPDKWYIGYSKNIYRRWNKVYRVNGCKGQRKLFQALRKYGYDGFNKVVVETCSTDPTVWGPLESKWIKHYNSIDNGYNIAEGGRGGSTHRGVPCSENTRRKISRQHIGKRLTNEHRKKISESLKRSGRTMSDEQRKKMFAGRHFLSPDEIRRRKNERNRRYLANKRKRLSSVLDTVA